MRVQYNSGAIRSLQDEPGVDQRVREVAEAMAEQMRSAAPVDTGELRDSVVVRADGAGQYQVGAEAEHAAHVEYGTSRTAPQPFIRSALDGSY